MSTTCLDVQWDWWTPDQNASPGGQGFLSTLFTELC